MKNKYTSPEIEVVDLEVEDVTNNNLPSVGNPDDKEHDNGFIDWGDLQ